MYIIHTHEYALICPDQNSTGNPGAKAQHGPGRAGGRPHLQRGATDTVLTVCRLFNGKKQLQTGDWMTIVPSIQMFDNGTINK